MGYALYLFIATILLIASFPVEPLNDKYHDLTSITDLGINEWGQVVNVISGCSHVDEKNGRSVSV